MRTLCSAQSDTRWRSYRVCVCMVIYADICIWPAPTKQTQPPYNIHEADGARLPHYPLCALTQPTDLSPAYPTRHRSAFYHISDELQAQARCCCCCSHLTLLCLVNVPRILRRRVCGVMVYISLCLSLFERNLERCASDECACARSSACDQRNTAHSTFDRRASARACSAFCLF